ncbi:MAG: hypothetical protein AAF500_22080 [Myxococcota bacterium]
MRTASSSLAWIFAAAVVALCAASSVSAQSGFDVRNIRPHTMLLIDTSGSMERKPNCICTTPACLECLPVCSAPTFEQNRWAIVAQALTGEFTPYECGSENRVGGIYTGEYDEGYFLPHILLPQEIGTYTGTQSGNGILDTYIERIKFGLMTFDSVGTLTDQPPLVTQTVFQTPPFPTDSAGTKGLYSYGNDAPFSFPGALTTYMINAGARSASAPEGGLVSMGDDSTASMNTTNASIQATILGDAGLGKNPLRPFGATPTAALVADLQFFTQNDPDFVAKVADPGPGDPFFSCRKRSAILITDGFPNGDMRGSPVECELLGAPVGPTGCPYEEVLTTVDQMVGVDQDLDEFYVIGFALDGDPAEVAAVTDLLNQIALVGGTVEARLVADRAELVTELSDILNEQNRGATSRTGPALTGLTPGLIQAEFISGFNPSENTSDPWDGVLERRRVICDGVTPVQQPVTDNDRFQLKLNNQTTAPSDVQPFSSDGGVTFGGTFSRNLWTVLPADPANINRHLVGNGKEDIDILGDDAFDTLPDSAEIRNVPAGEFNTAISPEYFFGVGSTDTAQRDTIVNYIHGTPGSGRENERLGDIYHSQPAIVGPIIDDTEDQSYNNWRLGFAHQESPDPLETTPNWALNQRPRVIYASTNDGIIHAFLADDYDPNVFTSGNNLDEFACADGLDAGAELWGFIPPMFLDDLDDLLAGGSKQWFADGNIVVRDLYDVRKFPTDDGSGDADSIASATNVWRTVLFLSFRNGGNGMIALDVTNPCKPEFMWQFTADDLGDTYGQPTAAQIFLEDQAPGTINFSPRQSHGVIILPGGQGVEDTALSPCTIPAGAALPQNMVEDDGSTSVSPRTERRCWRGSGSSPPAPPTGRVLYFIDLATGSILRQMGGDGPDGDGVFPAPLNGAVSVFRGDIGTVGSAAYTVDADGVLWRIDLSPSDPQNWEAEALHDIYHDGAFDDAEPTYYPPALSIDPDGNVVILTGTGNIDVLDDGGAQNKVISITEQLGFDSSGDINVVGGKFNWEEKLEDGEQMTGPIELFSGQAFFGTFESSGTNAIDQCGVEGSRIFGVDFLDFSPALVSMGSPAEFVDGSDIPDLADSLVIGVQVAQQPVCNEFTDITITDPFGPGTLALPTATSGREFKLIATLGGGSTPIDGLSIDVLDERITAPDTFTVVSGMAESLE